MNLEECSIVAATPFGGYIPFGVWACQNRREPLLVWESPRSDSDFPLSYPNPLLKIIGSKKVSQLFFPKYLGTLFSTFFINFLFLFFLAALGLPCCTHTFSSCGERELLFVVVCRLLIAVASLVAEHRL